MLLHFFCSSVRDGVHAAVGGEGEKIPEEQIGVCGQFDSVHLDRTTGERHLGNLSDSKTCENGLKSTCCGFRSWRIAWFSCWPDVPSQPIVSRNHQISYVVIP